jgi:L-alanine-DL-glutamate epimerase-like enolase superfamily enzyme
VLSRRTLLTAALALPAAAWLENFRSLAQAQVRQVKITDLNVMGLDNVEDGCLLRIETDAGLTGYGEIGLRAPVARARIDYLKPRLIGQDPLAIERIFHDLSTIQYSFIANIPTVSGIDIALWDLAGKILSMPIYRLLGGPVRKQIPVYSHGNGVNWLDRGAVRAWAQTVKAAPAQFNTFKIGYIGAPDPLQGGGNAGRLGGFNPLPLDGAAFNRVNRAFTNMREALGDDYELALHCTGQNDLPSAVGLCKAIEPIKARWIEDPLAVRYNESWKTLKAQTTVPLLAGEKVEMVEGFRPYLDNGVLDYIHPDPAYSGGITGCRRIADYAALSQVPVGMHSGPCTLVRWYASMHLGAAIPNFFSVENDLGAFRGNKENMAAGATKPAVRNATFPVPEGPGLGLELDNDWLRAHVAKEDTWWG